MSDLKLASNTEIGRAYRANERDVWIRNFRVACLLAAVFVLAGSSLDVLVAEDRAYVKEFFEYRLATSLLLLFIWWLARTPLGLRHYRVLGLLLPALPSLCCALMIYRSTGADSPYYAGLNLVLLGAAIILRWTFLDSLLVFFEVLGLYLAACILHGGIARAD